MFTENMSAQDWRMAALLQSNANLVRKQQQESADKRHNELLQEQRRAADRIASEHAAARRAAEQQSSEAREHNHLLLEQNRIANIQKNMLLALPMVSESDRFGYITGNLNEFVETPFLTFGDFCSRWARNCVDEVGDINWQSLEWADFQRASAEDIVSALILQSSFPSSVEKAQSFLPPQFRISIENWVRLFITQRLVTTVRLLQLDLPSAYASGKNIQNLSLNSLEWPVSSSHASAESLTKPIAYLGIVVALWNDNAISESELVKMIAILKDWNQEHTDDTAYRLLQLAVEEYTADLQSQNHENIAHHVNRICLSAHPEQAQWIFAQLEDLAGVDMVATDKQRDFLNLIKADFETKQKEKRELAAQLEALAPTQTVAAGCQKNLFDVILLPCRADRKISCIKTVREIVIGLGLVEAKTLVESAPKPLLLRVDKARADSAWEKLKEIGVDVEIK